MFLDEASGAVISGTNCANCRFARGSDQRKPTPDELDAQNGIKLQEKDYAKARTADLLTLPGKMATVKVFRCNHPKLNLDVTSHNCCAYWDNPGALRDFKGSR